MRNVLWVLNYWCYHACVSQGWNLLLLWHLGILLHLLHLLCLLGVDDTTSGHAWGASTLRLHVHDIDRGYGSRGWGWLSHALLEESTS